MLALARSEEIHLCSAGLKGTGILPAYAKKDKLSHVAEIEPDPTSIGTTVLTNLVPDDIAFVLKAPGLHDAQPLGQKRVRNPQIEMRSFGSYLGHWERQDVVERECAVPI